MANGRLAEAPDPRLVEVATRHGVGTDAIALAAVLAQPWCDVVLSGAVTEQQLDANLAAAEIQVDELPGLAEPADDYWETRSRLPWA